MASSFQVKLHGKWEDYDRDEDKILKRAFLAGFPNARYSLRGQQYEVDFKKMDQRNLRSGKTRDIRPPYKLRPPSAPICPPGPTACIKVPDGAAGTTIHVPHPRIHGQVIAVEVPATAKPGQAMLVPIPDAPAAAAPYSAPATPAEPAKSGGYSTGAKVAMGLGGVAVVGGLAVAGALLGEHIADEGWDATMSELGGAFSTAGDAIADAAGDAGTWAGGAADSAGDFIMDLF